MTIQTLDELLAITGTLTEDEALRNVANTVMSLTEVTRYHNGKGRARTYNGDIDACTPDTPTQPDALTRIAVALENIAYTLNEISDRGSGIDFSTRLYGR